jgi:hypothetical protein
MIRTSEPEGYAQTVALLCLGESDAYAEDPLHVYRRMVRNRFRDVLTASTPRFSKVVGERVMERWLERWLAGDGPTTRLFWALPLTARESVRALAATGEIAPWQLAIADYELAVWETRHAPFPADAPTVDFSFDLSPRITSAHLRRTLTHALSDVETPAADTHHVFFRKADGVVCVRTLNRVAGLVLDAITLPGDASLTTRMQAIVKQHGLKAGPEFAVSLGEMLAGWLEDGLLLGSAPA